MTLVFTNGCFDVLHVGHVRLLEFARSLGDRLVVGLNDDVSVRRLKGALRPIVSEHERREMLLALRAVDEVIVFGEPTPLALIERLRPDVLVKGPDYLQNTPVGTDQVMSWGGRVVVPNWPMLHSTTDLVSRIQTLLSPHEFVQDPSAVLGNG